MNRVQLIPKSIRMMPHTPIMRVSLRLIVMRDTFPAFTFMYECSRHGEGHEGLLGVRVEGGRGDVRGVRTRDRFAASIIYDAYSGGVAAAAAVVGRWYKSTTDRSPAITRRSLIHGLQASHAQAGDKSLISAKRERVGK